MAKQATLSGVSGVLWNDDGWSLGAETPCFVCAEGVGAVAIYWAGHAVAVCSGDGMVIHPEACVLTGSPVIAMHPRCAVRLAKELGEDAEREPRPVGPSERPR